jgi:hypothetical protein
MNVVFNNVPWLGQIVQVLAMFWWAIAVVVHVSLAVAVFKSASTLERQRGVAVLGAPIVWALATLMGGVLTALAYWFIHLSTLNPQKPESTNS